MNRAKEDDTLQLIELCPLNSSSSQFWRVRVAEVVDELMTEGVK